MQIREISLQNDTATERTTLNFYVDRYCGSELGSPPTEGMFLPTNTTTCWNSFVFLSVSLLTRRAAPGDTVEL